MSYTYLPVSLDIVKSIAPHLNQQDLLLVQSTLHDIGNMLSMMPLTAQEIQSSLNTLSILHSRDI